MRPLKVCWILLTLACASSASPPQESLGSHREIQQEALKRIDHLAAASELIPCGATPDQVRAEYGEPRRIEPITWSEYLVERAGIGALVSGPYVLHVFPIASPCEELPPAVVHPWPTRLPKLERQFGQPVRTGESRFWVYEITVDPSQGYARFGFFKNRAVYIKGGRSWLE